MSEIAVELTTRQKEILDLVIKGYIDKQIALKLNISQATVKTHLANITGRLKATNRTQAAITALKCGFLELPRGNRNNGGRNA